MRPIELTKSQKSVVCALGRIKDGNYIKDVFVLRKRKNRRAQKKRPILVNQGGEVIVVFNRTLQALKRKGMVEIFKETATTNYPSTSYYVISEAGEKEYCRITGRNPHKVSAPNGHFNAGIFSLEEANRLEMFLKNSDFHATIIRNTENAFVFVPDKAWEFFYLNCESYSHGDSGHELTAKATWNLWPYVACGGEASPIQLGLLNQSDDMPISLIEEMHKNNSNGDVIYE